jgi:UDP-glucose 4-epimerase
VYGRTKRVVEDFLRDLASSNANWRIAILRYFNPAGAHSSGMLGEAARGRPSNLVPLLCHIAAGDYPELSIYGNDWPTPDGTGIRDYLHVQDLAEGHLMALKFIARTHGAVTFNLGAGRGYSVMEVVDAFEHACGRRIDKTFAPRRPGDVACYYADPARAQQFLGWRATRELDAICADAWRWQKNGGRYYADAHRENAHFARWASETSQHKRLWAATRLSCGDCIEARRSQSAIANCSVARACDVNAQVREIAVLGLAHGARLAG